jgi:hypothetical protein
VKALLEGLAVAVNRPLISCPGEAFRPIAFPQTSEEVN